MVYQHLRKAVAVVFMLLFLVSPSNSGIFSFFNSLCKCENERSKIKQCEKKLTDVKANNERKNLEIGECNADLAYFKGRGSEGTSRSDRDLYCCNTLQAIEITTVFLFAGFL
ncbi:hypothetical protein ATZ36_15325 [Candidatus Endomicrobiellum trichonymphae]|uniref:Uncharacterized protein n=1 Tax=Endomicrobium trichonymphae TaxID=1408204 RepID=A0A1E5ILI9_ENDTX|nr:hypothetical protein ATZ36_15325 [Candidatus Endomicrobium trichonymphae]